MIFLDPPYAKQTIEQDIENILNQDLLDEVALIVCEVASDVTLPEEINGLQLWDERKFGNRNFIFINKSIR